MLTIQERQQYILDQVSRQGFLRAEDVAEKLGVSSATIRKDLRTLEARHLIHRSHGSASPVKSGINDLPVQEKSAIRTAEKNAIARAAAAMIRENDSIILTSGSTIEALAALITAKGHLDVITPSIRVGVTLGNKENIDVLMLGGRLVAKSLSVRDSYSIEGLRNTACSTLFFSCDGFDLHSGATTAFVEEARLTDAMMQVCAQKVLLADSSKLGKQGFGQICPLSAVDVLITDKGIPAETVNALKELGVEVVIV